MATLWTNVCHLPRQWLNLNLKQPVIPHAMAEPTKNLYGPWMIATSRWRKTTKTVAPGAITGVEQGNPGGSRFATSPVDDVSGDTQVGMAQVVANQNEPVEEVVHKDIQVNSRFATVAPQKTFTKNAAYLASNPDRKSKKSPTVGMNVVSLADGNAARVITHTVQRCLGNHNAISIVEPGYDAKHRSELQRRSPSYLSVEWANDLSKLIDVLAAKENRHPNAPVRRDQLHVDMELSSEDGGEFVANSMDLQDFAVDRGLPAHGLEQ
ncbi:hypothetical protein V6N12_027679 [Hibiscus sabdariffa]|uniref:Uncharacterized protein n=1 Tax=Hibiscus sabdariffa TaxID=183260 RepID=A0ABR2F3L1_9ROSI